jgi:hypothetical protein
MAVHVHGAIISIVPRLTRRPAISSLRNARQERDG